ncbi:MULTISPECIES: M23 family metallopeptidase [unclassified Pseudoclavibacter]|uniref:M23 family metallopeptidase n=1 Tax=unclassified Pseudoclavibacter TaxID=2615177 RepID=UPI00130107B3|nr:MULTISPECIES: M23 family metallopeptidase [unclassified Pseudoclavibacter]KAB1647290.1 M23 family metallopeptidase [Pseudoclavibacter sp. CFCC 14310]KAB1662717.1 M23 family metallopeptidase [Pseudoclavibacter sp. CFCC 13611]
MQSDSDAARAETPAEQPLTRRQMREIWAAQDRLAEQRAQDSSTSETHALLPVAIPGHLPVSERMPRRQQLPDGGTIRRRRSLSLPFSSRRMRSTLIFSVAMGLSFTAAVPAYAVSPSVSATVDMTRTSPQDLVRHEAELVDNGHLQSGALLASSASAVGQPGDELLTAEARSAARLTVNNVCELGQSPYTDDVQFSIPVPQGSYTVSSRLGERWGRMHKGVDFAAPIGTTIAAAMSGTITNVGFTGVNPYVQLTSRLPDGTKIDTLYLHMPLDSVRVQVGDQVKTGQPIAEVGNEGNSQGAHLHFELHINGGADVTYGAGEGTIVDGLDWLQAHDAATLPGCTA